jgi:hypothetical protein
MTVLLPSHVLAEIVALGIMTLAAFWGLAYAWWNWRLRLAKEMLPFWRRTFAGIGLLAVTAQALLFILSWTRIGRDSLLFGRWANWLDPTFLVAVPCVLAGKGPTRWWLLSSSVLLFIMCFLFTLTA